MDDRQSTSNLVGLAEAARLLTAAGDKVARNTLSVYVGKHADSLQPVTRGRETVVDFEALKAHRAENIRITRPGPFAGVKSRSDEAGAKMRVDRQIRELDLAERQGILTPLLEVQSAAHTAIALMRAEFATAINETSESIAAALGGESRLVRPHLRALEKKALDRFVRSLTDSLRLNTAA
jgi:hypothetical protein